MKVYNEILDNFLPNDQFETLQKFILSKKFPWHFNEYIHPTVEEIFNFQFVHMFYSDLESPPFPLSQYQKKVSPIVDILDPLKLNRIKANLIPITPEIIKDQFHTDVGAPSVRHVSEYMKKWTTAIFYINTNNGYTELEDGTIIESIANRLVKFPANTNHRGTSCTDQRVRVVINFNYQ